MKAISIIPGTKQLELLELEQPEIKNRDDVLVKVSEIGISAIDRRIATGEVCEAPPGSTHLVLGHEMMGYVVDVGSAVKYIKPGDPVTLTVRRGCGQCAQCARGNTDLCFTGLYAERGIRRLNGYMTEYVVENEANVIAVPPNIKDIAVLLKPLSLGEKAIAAIVSVGHRMDGPPPWPRYAYHYPEWGADKAALVAGGTAVAVLSTFLLRINSVRTYLLADKPKGGYLASLVEGVGATYIERGAVPIDDLVKEVGRMDIVIDATGATQFDFKLVELVGPSGVYTATTVPASDSEVIIDGNSFMGERFIHSQVLFGSVSANRRHFEQGVKDLQHFRDNFGAAVNSVITHRYAFLDFEAAFAVQDTELIKAILEI